MSMSRTRPTRPHGRCAADPVPENACFGRCLFATDRRSLSAIMRMGCACDVHVLCIAWNRAADARHYRVTSPRYPCDEHSILRDLPERKREI